MRAGAPGNERSVQPTTAQINPAEPRATSSMKAVSASVSAACTSTVAVMPPNNGRRSSSPWSRAIDISGDSHR